MRRRSIAEVLTGAVVLLVAAGFLAYAVAHSGRTAASGYTLYAKFDHIDGLGVGADVRLAGVKVGSVTEERIDPQSFLAVVALTVRDDIKLPKDSAASSPARACSAANTSRSSRAATRRCCSRGRPSPLPSHRSVSRNSWASSSSA